ncbi:hypothetical protein ABZ342_35235 [Amycolatopsis sp. NPDC005961]|uniref:hypothetical protein n=1 Tax=Amycolatopsis sp. NPDC005961 TaxID=3156720 RepID=UPI00340CFC0B
MLTAVRTTKSIQDIGHGDMVLNASPDDGKVQSHVVQAVHVTDDDTDFVDLVIAGSGGTGVTTATAHHFFWDDTTRRWAYAADLVKGQQLDTPDDVRASTWSEDCSRANLLCWKRRASERLKSGTANRDAAQRAFENWVESGNIAKGTGQAQGFRIIGVRLVNV